MKRLAGMSTLAVSCSSTINGKALAADNSGPVTPTPIVVSALDGLLLEPSQINQVVGATAMNVWFSAKAMWTWSSSINDKNCLAIDRPAQDKVYANTGCTCQRGWRLQPNRFARDRHRFADRCQGGRALSP